jgi:hypothetical protein
MMGATSRVAAYHHASGLRARCRYSGLCGEPVEPAIPWSEDNSLQATVTANEFHPRRQEWFVVFTGSRVHEVNRCQVAFAAFGGSKPAGAANVHELYRDALCS